MHQKVVWFGFKDGESGPLIATRATIPIPRFLHKRKMLLVICDLLLLPSLTSFQADILESIPSSGGGHRKSLERGSWVGKRAQGCECLGVLVPTFKCLTTLSESVSRPFLRPLSLYSTGYGEREHLSPFSIPRYCAFALHPSQLSWRPKLWGAGVGKVGRLHLLCREPIMMAVGRADYPLDGDKGKGGN